MAEQTDHDRHVAEVALRNKIAEQRDSAVRMLVLACDLLETTSVQLGRVHVALRDHIREITS